MKAAAHRFFVRISGMPEEKGAQVKALFGDVDMIQVKDGEFGIVTPQMKEKDFDEKAAALDGMITRIRGEF